MQKSLKKSHVPGMYFRDCSLTRIMGHSWVNYGRHHSTRKYLALDAPDDEHLHVCLQDFTWLAKFGEESIRAGWAFTRDQISLERARRGRVPMSQGGSQWPVSQSL